MNPRQIYQDEIKKGDEYRDKMQLSDALQSYKTAIAIDDTQYLAYAMIGDLYEYNYKDTTKALPYYQFAFDRLTFLLSDAQQAQTPVNVIEELQIFKIAILGKINNLTKVLNRLEKAITDYESRYERENTNQTVNNADQKKNESDSLESSEVYISLKATKEPSKTKKLSFRLFENAKTRTHHEQVSENATSTTSIEYAKSSDSERSYSH